MKISARPCSILGLLSTPIGFLMGLVLVAGTLNLMSPVEDRVAQSCEVGSDGGCAVTSATARTVPEPTTRLSDGGAQGAALPACVTIGDAHP